MNMTSACDLELIGPGSVHITKIDFLAPALAPKDVEEWFPKQSTPVSVNIV